MASFTKSEMKMLCDYVGCDSNGDAGEMKFNVLLKIRAEDPDDDDTESEDDEAKMKNKAANEWLENQCRANFSAEEMMAVESEEEAVSESDEVLYRWIEVKTDGWAEDAEWYKIKKSATIGDLKTMIQKREDILLEEQRIVFKGKKLSDDSVISSLQVDDPETVRLHFIIELTGGGKILIISWKSFM